jgi:hypothetical protein
MKFVHGMRHTHQAIYRPLKVNGPRGMLGVDNFSVSPKGSNGESHLVVCVELYTKFTSIYPATDYGAGTLASIMLFHFSIHGTFDILRTDPGSDFMSNVIVLLNKWLGIAHEVSLVDVHTSNGVERTNGRILTLLRTIIADTRVKSEWSSRLILGTVQYVLNSRFNSEIGMSPFEAKFGSTAAKYARFPEDLPVDARASLLLRRTNDAIRVVSEIVDKFHARVVAKRAKAVNSVLQTTFQPGDFVLFLLKQPPEKLDAKLAGPYRVLWQQANDVSCKDLVTGAIKVFHVDRLTLFAGSEGDAKLMAYRDANQALVARVDLWQGDPLQRLQCIFRVIFADGSVIWQGFSPDIAETHAFADFCAANPPCALLTRTAALARQEVTRIRRSSIVDFPLWLPGTLESSPRTPTLIIASGLKFFLDLRAFSETWDFNEFYKLKLPGCLDEDAPPRLYVVECVYGSFANKACSRINAKCPLFDSSFVCDTYWVVIWGTRTIFDPSTMVLVDATLNSLHRISLAVMPQPLR